MKCVGVVRQVLKRLHICHLHICTYIVTYVPTCVRTQLVKDKGQRIKFSNFNWGSL